MDKDPFLRSVFKDPLKKTDHCLYFFKYSPGVLVNKTKVLDILITDKKYFIKINIK